MTDDISARRDATGAGPGRIRTAALATAVPIAFAVGALVAAPFGALGSASPLGSSAHLTARTSLAGGCHGGRPQARLATEVTVSTVGTLKWPDCAGD